MNPLLSRLLHPLATVLHLMPRSGRLLMLAAAGLLSAVLWLLFNANLHTLEERLGALGWTLDADDTAEQRITLVTIDEKSLDQLGWPWSRQQMAELVNAIDSAGAQLQLYDIVFSEPRPGDDALLSALTNARGAVLAQVPVLASDQVLRTGQMTHPVSGVDCQSGITASGNFIAPHQGFSTINAGHITTNIASDGAIRSIPALVCVDQQVYPALGLSALLQGLGSEQWGVTLSDGEGLLAPDKILQLNSYPGLNIPLDADGNLRISYKNAPISYRAVSAVDVLSGNFDADMFDNTWVLIGATAFGIGDIVPTPYTGATPGVELHARILGSLLDAEIPYTPGSDGLILGLLTLLFAAILFGLASARDRIANYGLPLAAVLLPVCALLLHMRLLGQFEIWLGWLYPALYSICAGGLLVLLEQSRLRSERSRVYNNLNAYLPNDVAREIAYSLPSSSINARRCNVTLLSADLRNFAAFGESRPPEESAAVLHYFFMRATEIVEQHGGRIHEFKGDAVLAVWDGQHEAAAANALNAARDMQLSINQGMLPQHPPAGLEPLALGIGIEQGPALIGSIGPAHRRSHTLMGDTVTITLRIQEMTAELAQPILVGECAARQLSNFALESQGNFLLDGLRIPHTLFALPAPSREELRRQTDPQSLKVIRGGRQ